MRNPRRVLSKAQILDRVWNYDFGGQANVVELYISYLRKKIDAEPAADDPHHARRGLRAAPRGLMAASPPRPVGCPTRSSAGPGHAGPPARAAGGRPGAPRSPCCSACSPRWRPGSSCSGSSTASSTGRPASSSAAADAQRGAAGSRRRSAGGQLCPASPLGTLAAEFPTRQTGDRPVDVPSSRLTARREYDAAGRAAAGHPGRRYPTIGSSRRRPRPLPADRPDPGRRGVVIGLPLTRRRPSAGPADRPGAVLALLAMVGAARRCPSAGRARACAR